MSGFTGVIGSSSGLILNVTVANGGGGLFGYDTAIQFSGGSFTPNTTFQAKTIARFVAGSDNSFTFAVSDGVNDLGQLWFRRLTVQSTAGTVFILNTSASTHTFFNLSRNEWLWTGLASDVWTSTGTHWVKLE